MSNRYHSRAPSRQNGLGCSLTSVLNRLLYDGEFPHWLAAIRQAIVAAKMTRADRADMRGAFEMATVIPYDARERRGYREHC